MALAYLSFKWWHLSWIFFYFPMKRWSSVLSRGRSLFLEPDADMEDSKWCCFTCALWPNFRQNDNAQSLFPCFLFSVCSSLPPWSPRSPSTSSSASITTTREIFPTQVSSTLDALRVMWDAGQAFCQLWFVIVKKPNKPGVISVPFSERGLQPLRDSFIYCNGSYR